MAHPSSLKWRLTLGRMLMRRSGRSAVNGASRYRGTQQAFIEVCRYGCDVAKARRTLNRLAPSGTTTTLPAHFNEGFFVSAEQQQDAIHALQWGEI